MSYQVLARKWRPRTFRELVGQEPIVRALTNALDRQRLHHAFLFTGTRGVGKTTLARIFAKSLNCETGISSTPCGECSACREIDDGRFVDLLEVDAASRTKVEDTRDLLENVQYAPSRGRFKVYLIDEVHMLSAHSFNALLKTLEEPPPHVKFLLATTDPQKLPVTILSRCLQFGLRRLPAAMIAAYLAKVLAAEGIPSDEAALRLLARAGDGSMRDALSLLDQAIAFGAGRVEQAEVATMLGVIDRRWAVSLLEMLASHDAPALLGHVAQLDESAPDYATVLADLLSLLQQVALFQVAPSAAAGDGIADAEDLARLAGSLSPEDVQLFYQIALLGRRDLALAPDPRGGFEMALLRMLCFRPAILEHEEGAQAVAPHLPAPPAFAPAPVSTAAEPVTAPSAPPPPAVTSLPALEAAGPDSGWSELVEQLALGGMAKQLALNCVLVAREGNHFCLALDAAHAQMRNKTSEERLRAALEQQLGAPANIRFQVGNLPAATPAEQRLQHQNERRQAAAERIDQDPRVREMQEVFGAEIKGVQPLDDFEG
ncbi:MAG: DNA polymerase III subunit gamma/tau [Candidatus Competibacteraceae bacterium]|nr:DNA polymerase III subunit gamma/tau [Candidatus Competibacteraceae bacterium]